MCARRGALFRIRQKCERRTKARRACARLMKSCARQRHKAVAAVLSRLTGSRTFANAVRMTDTREGPSGVARNFLTTYIYTYGPQLSGRNFFQNDFDRPRALLICSIFERVLHRRNGRVRKRERERKIYRILYILKIHACRFRIKREEANFTN